MYKIYTTFMRPSKDVPFYHERADMFPILNTITEIVKSSPHVLSRETTLSEDELIYTVITSFEDKQAWMMHKYELMAADVTVFVNRNSYCLENNINVVREWTLDDGPKHLANDTNLDQLARIFFGISSVSAKLGDSPCLVTFSIESEQAIVPSTSHTYSVICDINPNFNGTFSCTESSVNSITLSYPNDPGTYSPDSGEFEGAMAIITMNP